MSTTTTATISDTFATLVARRVMDVTNQMRELSSGASLVRPSAHLAGHLDRLHNQIAAAFAAQVALTNATLADNTGRLLDARTPDDLHKAVAILDAVHVTVQAFATSEAANVVAQMRQDAVRLLESALTD